MEQGKPNSGIPSLSRAFLTSVAFSVLSAGEGKASGHLVSVSGNTSRYLNPPGALGRTGQSSCVASLPLGKSWTRMGAQVVTFGGYSADS